MRGIWETGIKEGGRKSVGAGVGLVRGGGELPGSGKGAGRGSAASGMLREAGAEGGRTDAAPLAPLRTGCGGTAPAAAAGGGRLRGRHGAAPVPCRLRTSFPAAFERFSPRSPI